MEYFLLIRCLILNQLTLKIKEYEKQQKSFNVYEIIFIDYYAGVYCPGND